MENSRPNPGQREPQPAVGPLWHTIPVMHVLLSPAAAATNGLLLVLFLRRRSLLTSFNVYLVFLLSLNFIFAIMIGPLDVLKSLYEKWPFSSQLCSLHIYGTNSLLGNCGLN